jgi:hypothetical protein
MSRVFSDDDAVFEANGENQGGGVEPAVRGGPEEAALLLDPLTLE